MAGRKDIVHVTSSLPAQSRPNFLIRGPDDRLYLTVAVIEYCREEAKTEEQKAGVELMSDLFRRTAESVRGLECYPVDTSGWTGMNLQPPAVGTGPGVGTQGSSVGDDTPDDDI